MKPRYKFSHRAKGRLYWTRRAPDYGPAYEEIVSCNALWFHGQISEDTSLPCCDRTCGHGGEWGATGIMPPGHVLVVTSNRQYLAHVRSGGEHDG